VKFFISLDLDLRFIWKLNFCFRSQPTQST